MTTSSPHTIEGLPVFPLGTLLFPGGLLSLQIFEVRYLNMIGKALKAGTPFGVVTLTQGHEVRQRKTQEPGKVPPGGDGFAHEAFHAVGTLATIRTHVVPQPGLMVVQCLGTQRFEITRREQLKHGLWVADIACLPDDRALAIPADLQIVADALAAFIRQSQLRELQGVTADVMPLASPYQLGDCAWVANRWVELLPVPVEVKYRLMALDNPLLRLELVRDLLDTENVLAR